MLTNQEKKRRLAMARSYIERALMLIEESVPEKKSELSATPLDQLPHAIQGCIGSLTKRVNFRDHSIPEYIRELTNWICKECDSKNYAHIKVCSQCNSPRKEL